MKSKVQKWGNSLAVRIPKTFAEEVGLTDNSPIEMRLVQGGLLVEPAAVWSPSLEELLEAVDETNVHGEEGVGPPQGREVW